MERVRWSREDGAFPTHDVVIDDRRLTVERSDYVIRLVEIRRMFIFRRRNWKNIREISRLPRFPPWIRIWFRRISRMEIRYTFREFQLSPVGGGSDEKIWRQHDPKLCDVRKPRCKNRSHGIWTPKFLWNCCNPATKLLRQTDIQTLCLWCRTECLESLLCKLTVSRLYLPRKVGNTWILGLFTLSSIVISYLLMRELTVWRSFLPIDVSLTK